MKKSAGRYIKVPKLFRELFGERTTKAELTIVLLTCLMLSTLLLGYNYDEWGGLVIWKSELILMLTLDITGGVIANLTEGTNRYYREKKKMRIIFLIIHIQPLLVGWLLGKFHGGLAVWAGTILFTVIIQRLKGGILRSAGMAAAAVGILLLITISGMSFLLNALLALYMVKLMFSFAVDYG